MKEKACLLINTRFYPSVGGVETTLTGMTKSLTSNNNKVIVVSNNLVNNNSNMQPGFENIFGADIYRYKYLPGVASLMTCIPLLLRLKNRYDFELVISRSVFTTVCCLLVGLDEVKYVAPALTKNQNKPLYMSKNILNLRKYMSYYLNSSIEKRLLKSLKKIYVFSDNMIEQVKDINNSINIIKIFPGVDLEQFREVSTSEKKELRKKYRLPLNKKIILFPARIEKVKNPKDAVDLLKYLSDDYILVVVGSGSFKNELVEYTKKTSYSDRVFFFDFTNEPEVFYKLADIFVLTSTYEPFGQVILEALATNIPVFGYESSQITITATSEIFELLKINKQKFLSSYEEGSEGLSKLIESYLMNSDNRVKFSVRDWNDFILDIRLN